MALHTEASRTTPTYLYEWKTLEPYEIRVFRDLIVQLCNKVAVQIEKAVRYTNYTLFFLRCEEKEKNN